MLFALPLRHTHDLVRVALVVVVAVVVETVGIAVQDVGVVHIVLLACPVVTIGETTGTFVLSLFGEQPRPRVCPPPAFGVSTSAPLYRPASPSFPLSEKPESTDTGGEPVTLYDTVRKP